MTVSSDSDDAHRAVKKNGKDQLQDRELRELADQIRRQQEQEARHHEQFVKFTKQDLGSHEALDRSVDSVREIAVTVKNQLDRYTFTGKVLWAIAGLFWSALVAGVGYVSSQVGSMDDRIREAGVNVSRIEATDAAIKEAIDHVEDDIRELRQWMQEHQRNGKHEGVRKEK